MNILKESPVLISTTKKNTTKFWKAYITEEDSKIYINREYWQTLTNSNEISKVNKAVPKLVKPKNIGKSNETTVIEQAELELESLIKKQYDKGYWEEGTEPNLKILPMLAHEYTKHWKKLKNTKVHLQPKLDGVRCLYKPDLGFYSRKGKSFIDAVQNLFDIELNENKILDGELILPSDYTFQETISAVKREQELTYKLKFVVYDLYDLENTLLTYEQRYEILKSLKFPVNVELIDSKSITISSISDIYEAHEGYCNDGYEGTIIRASKGFYEVNKRSYNLLKYKDFKTDEFLVVDCEYEMVNKTDKAAILVCSKHKVDCNMPEVINENGITETTCEVTEQRFKVRMKSTVEERVEIYNNFENYKGKYLTVQYQELTDDGIPRFPVGIAFRNYE